jgi:hypothetical protein
MYIEQHAKQLVAYCADVARQMTQDDTSFFRVWTPVLDTINAQLPRGSGFDAGSRFLPEDSTQSRLVFETAFHHMDDAGMYDGWTNHQIIVNPSFDGFDIRVTGRDRNGIKDRIAECFYYALSGYWKVQFNAELREMDIVPADYDYGFVK